jgi:hypothetical protein
VSSPGVGGVEPWEWSSNPSGPAPYTYSVPASLVVEPYTATATYDGTDAAGNFVPTLSIYSQSGALLASVAPSWVVMTPGEVAEVSFIPPFGAAPASSPPSGSSDYVFLAEETPNGDGNIVFSDIPQTYRHLVVEMALESTDTEQPLFITWTDDDTPYSSNFAYVESGGAVHGSSVYRSETGMPLMPGASFGPGLTDYAPLTITLKILYYANTSQPKAAIWTAGGEQDDTDAPVWFSGGGQISPDYSSSTVAVTSLTIGSNPPSGEPLAASSIASLYGIV